MSEPPADPSKRPVTVPDPPDHWIYTLGKILLFLVAGAVVLSVLVFGTCLLLMRR